MALVVLALISAIALPIYSAYSVRAYRANAQADLMRCAQGMERHANATMSYALAVDTDGDGIGDASTGAVSANICVVTADHYTISVRAAGAGGFALRATAVSGVNPVAGDGMLETDDTGARRWDRNNDGDFDDQDEAGWRL